MKHRILITAFTILLSLTAKAQWTNYSFPNLDVLLDIYFTDANNGFVCGYQNDASNNMYNRIYRTTNGGTTWTQTFEVYDAIANFTSHSLHAFYFTSPTNGFCVGGRNGIYPFICSTIDGGATWDTLSLPYTSFVVNISFPDASTGYICGEPPTAATSLFKTTNGGTSWTDISAAAGTAMNYCPIKDVHFLTPTDGFACTLPTSNQQAGIYKTTDGGLTWTQQYTIGNNEGFTSIQFINSTTGFASGTIGKAYKTTNGGATWTAIPLGIQNDVQDIYFINSQTGYAASTSGFDGAIYKTTNGGSTWTVDNTGNFIIMYAYYSLSISNGTGYACGFGGYSKNSNMPQAINEENNTIDLTVYPNPASNQVTFNIENPYAGTKQLILRNVLGEEVQIHSFSGSTFTLPLIGLASGVYSYELTGEDDCFSKGSIVVE